MADDTLLRIGVEANIGDLKSKMIEASGSVESASQRMAAALKAQGLTAKEIAMGLESVGLSAKGLVPATETAAVGISRVGGAMGEARVIAGTLDGSVGMISGGFARLAAQSATLAPIIRAAFVPFAIVAFADIIGTVAEKIAKMTETMAGYTAEVQKAEKADDEFSTKALSSAADLEQAQEKLHAIVIESGKAAEETFGQKFSSSFQTATGAAVVHEGVLASLRDALIATAKDPLSPFEALTGSIKGLFHAEGDAANAALKLRAAQDSLLKVTPELILQEDREAVKLMDLQAAVAKVGLSRAQQLQVEINDLKQKEALEESIARAEVAQRGGDAAAQERAAFAVQEEYFLKLKELSAEYAAQVAKDQDRIARETTAAAVKLKEDLKKVTLPSNDNDLFAAIAQNMPKAAAEWQKGLNDMLNAQIKTDTAIDVAMTKDLNERVAAIAKADAKIRAEEKKATEELTRDWQSAFQAINQPLMQFTHNVMSGTETVGQAFKKMGSSMLTSVVTSLEQAVLKHAEYLLITDVLEKSSMANRLITWASGEATKKAAETTAAEGEVATFAGAGGAAAYASVMESLPFPANVAAAPGVAASTVAAIEGFGAIAAFEKGGIVPATGLALVHQGEKILPKSQSGNGNVGGNRTYNIHINAGGSSASGMTHADIVKAVKMGIRRGELNLA